MAILIDPKGLLEGKRLRKLCYMSRLYYPFLLSMTNFYARIEIDPELLAMKLSMLKDPTMNEEAVETYFTDYSNAGLGLLYEAKGSRWMQFDTPLKMRASFPTNEDNSSPEPPVEEYTTWLKS